LRRSLDNLAVDKAASHNPRICRPDLLRRALRPRTRLYEASAVLLVDLLVDSTGRRKLLAQPNVDDRQLNRRSVPYKFAYVVHNSGRRVWLDCSECRFGHCGFASISSTINRLMASTQSSIALLCIS